jgi:hypothetical protein
MSNKIEFVKWLSLQEYADYGFADKLKNKQTSSGLKEKPENVIFKVDEFLDILTEILESDNLKIIRKWTEEIHWSDNGHYMEVNVNPLGSLRITTRKFIKDIKGNKTPLCKDVFDLDKEHNGKENLVAEKIYKRIKRIRENNYDHAVSNYSGLEKLSKILFKACLETYPSYIMFPKGLKKMDDNYYKIFFEFKGNGAGVPGNSRAEQFDIDLNYDKEKGLIRCWGYNIDSPMKQREFIPQTSEWNEYFSPNEKPEKIVMMMIKTLMTY